MAKGWICLHRCIEDNLLWGDKPFAKGQAWIDLILQANYRDKKILLGNKTEIVERGSKITSIRKLCERWGWSNTKVKNFLELLQEENMIVVKSDSKKTLYTIVNYNDYQDLENEKNDTETTQKRHESDTKATQKHTNNNINNINNNNNIYISDKKEFAKEIDAYTDNEDIKAELYEFIKMRKKIKKPLTARALKIIFTKLDNLANTDAEKTQILQNSIVNSWQGVFPLKNKMQQKQTNSYMRREIGPTQEEDLEKMILGRNKLNSV